MENVNGLANRTYRIFKCRLPNMCQGCPEEYGYNGLYDHNLVGGGGMLCDNVFCDE